MASVVVTGGSGKAGSAIIRDLLSHGHAVMNVDVTPPQNRCAIFFKADLSDPGAAVDALRRAAGTVDRRRTPLGDATCVIHMAGIPAPSLAPDAVTFQNNLMSTYNVFSAATLFGYARVVWATSETAYGIPMTRSPPQFAPITEDHPLSPETGYALAKVLCERMAEQMHRWNPATRFIGLRISNIFLPADYAAIPSYSEDIGARQWNLWSWVDARDVAQACRRAIEVDVPGCDVFTIAAADTVMRQSSRDLMAQAFPGVPVADDLATHGTLLSIAKAARMLGYKPAWTWR